MLEARPDKLTFLHAEDNHCQGWLYFRLPLKIKDLTIFQEIPTQSFTNRTAVALRTLLD